MNVTIFGAGNMGRGIGHRLVAGGHQVTIIDNKQEDAEALARELGSNAKAGNKENPAIGDVVILAVKYGAHVAIAEQLGNKLAGKIVVDITNPLNASYDGLVSPSSAAEELAAVVAPGAQVVKAFNTTFASTLVAGNVAGSPVEVLIAGDNADAKNTISQLASDGGLVAVDAGPLARARQLENLALLGITMQFVHNTGFGTTWKFVRP